MIDLLNQELSNIIDLSMQSKQAHWNVKGPHFVGLHELFDKVAETSSDFADEIAERLVQLGGIALGTLPIAAKNSKLPQYPLEIHSGKEHVEALSTSMAEYATSTREAIDKADEAGDADTSDLFTEVSRGVEKLLWMVEANLQSDV